MNRNLTNVKLDAERDAIRNNPDDRRCPACFGWGFPIMAFGGRETYNVRIACPDCGATGKDPAKKV